MLEDKLKRRERFGHLSGVNAVRLWSFMVALFIDAREKSLHERTGSA